MLYPNPGSQPKAGLPTLVKFSTCKTRGKQRNKAKEHVKTIFNQHNAVRSTQHPLACQNIQPTLPLMPNQIVFVINTYMNK